MKKKYNGKKYTISNPRSIWPKVPAPKGYIYNVNGALFNWSYVVKEMKRFSLEIYEKLEPQNLKLQEFFILYCEEYEMEFGVQFPLNNVRDN